MPCACNGLFALFFVTLPIPALSQAPAFAVEAEARLSQHGVTGETAPRLAGNHEQTTGRSGGTYPAYRAGQTGLAASANAQSGGAGGLGQLPRPFPGDRSIRNDFPPYGPPPGWGPPMDRQRQRMGPGYPGLRGPGTGYPQHRQYGNPIRYPAWAPRGSD